MNLPESDSYDGLFMLPPNAYGNRNKRNKDNSDKNDGESDGVSSDSLAQNDDKQDLDGDQTEESAKGRELVERQKWEVTAVPIAEAESSELDNKSWLK